MTSEAGSTSQRGRPRDARSHQAVLAATLDLLGEVGYRRFTVGGVAKRAGVGKSTIYRWWPSKLDLILEAAAPQLEIGLAPDTGSTRHDLNIGAEQAIASFSRPIAAQVLFVVIADLEEDPRLREIYQSKWVLPWRVSMANALERGIANGDLAKGLDVELVIDMLAGTIFQRVLVIPEPMTDGLAQRLIDLVIRGKLP